MNKFYHSVYLYSDRCTGCFTCLKRCPTEAIRIRDGKAFIISKFCIDCGECCKHCPHHAKRSHRDEFETVREEFSYLIALPAPALYAQFNNLLDINILLSAILLSGFDDVFEVSSAAEIVTLATKEYITEHPEKWPVLSSACPTIERLIRVRFPNLLEHLLPLLPPMEIAAKLARERAVKKTGLSPEEIGVVFISPCPSKIAFTKAPLGLEKSNVDRVIAIKDFYPTLLSHMKDAEANPQFLAQSGHLGKSWASSEGEALGLNIDQYLAADGIENVIKVLEDLEDEKFQPGLQFVELNSCNAGCVGGVLTVENAYLAKAKLKNVTRDEPYARTGLFTYRGYEGNTYDMENTIDYEPVYRLGDTIFESMANMQLQEELLATLPQLDCGCCGAPTCQALVQDSIMEKTPEALEKCIFKDRVKKEEQ